MADEMAAGPLDEFDGAGEEFLYLLRPIRDLRRNWEEDICQHLKDFLEELIETEGVFNFVRAAAVIIGNTNIYGKKVDYVHQLALNFFGQISESQRRRREDAGNESDDGDGGGEGGPEDGEAKRKKKAEQRKQRKRQTLRTINNLITELVGKSRPKLPMVPVAFTPLADYEKMNVPLYSRLDPSEVVGKKDDFKVNTFYIHQGVALADLKNLELVDKFSVMGDGVSGRTTRSQTTHTRSHNTRNTTRPMSRRDPTTVSGVTAPSLEHPVGGAVAVDDVEFHNDQAGDDGTANDYFDEELMIEEGDTVGLSNLYGGNGSQLVVDGNARRARASRRTQPQGWEAQLQIADPFEEKQTEKCVPFSENRKCCIDASKQIERREKKVENECRAKGVPNVKSLKAYSDSRMYSRRVKMDHFVLSEFNGYISDQGQIAIASLIFAEERRRKKFRSTAPKAAEGRGGEPASRTQSAGSANGQENSLGSTAGRDASGQDQNGEMWMDNASNLGDRLSINDLEDSLGIQNLYARMPVPRSARRRRYADGDDEVMVHNYDDTFYADGNSDYDEDELPSRPISQMQYEEVVAFHLRKYWSSTEENQSVFAERVSKWEEKMAPILDREQRHRNFDAREYGDEVMAQFAGEIGSEIGFTQILEGVPRYELSRYLLVTLILANTLNVEVVADQQAHGTSPDNEVHLKLLKLERHHEVFEDEQRLMMGGPPAEEPRDEAR